jgi:uncharacterized protein YceH (UPF0502 family)
MGQTSPMMLRSSEARVLACLVEKQTTVPDTYPLTMKALRSACNQTSNRNPVTNLDETTIEAALVGLKAAGLVRFVHPSHGGRTMRYRHVADEVWELGRGELGVLAMLILRGPETAATLRARAERHLDEGGVSVTEALDTLMTRSEPFVRRLPRGAGEREPRYAELLADRTGDAGEVEHDTVEHDTVEQRSGERGANEPGSAAASFAGDNRTTADEDDISERAAAPVFVSADDSIGGSRSSPASSVGSNQESVPVTAAFSEVSPAASGDSGETAELVEALLDEVGDLRRRIERLERLYDG